VNSSTVASQYRPHQGQYLTDPQWSEDVQEVDVKGIWDLLIKEEDIQVYMRQINEDASHIHSRLLLAREHSEVLAEQLENIVCHHISQAGSHVGSLGTALFDIDQQWRKANIMAESFNHKSFPRDLFKDTVDVFGDNAFPGVMAGTMSSILGNALGGPIVGLGTLVIAGSVIPILFAGLDVWAPMARERKDWVETCNRCIELLGESASRLHHARQEFDVQYNAVMGEDKTEQ